MSLSRSSSWEEEAVVFASGSALPLSGTEEEETLLSDEAPASVSLSVP